jgi:glycosyltransferase involved in cell wall biosynthesis
LVWYPDLQHERHPEFFATREVAERRRQWAFLKERANGLLVISRGVAQDAIAFGFPAGRVHVSAPRPSFAADDLSLEPAAVARAFGVPTPFFVVCNQFWQHKNHDVVLQAVRLLNERRERVTVVFTGHTHDYRNARHFDGFIQRINRLGLWGNCRVLGRVDRPEQLALMRGAVAVIQPSLFEGRGLIVEEAQALGVPVLCSRLPVHAEAASAGTLFFEPKDASELATLMARTHSGSRRPLNEVLDGSRRNALAYGDELMNVFAEVLRQRPSGCERRRS